MHTDLVHPLLFHFSFGGFGCSRTVNFTLQRNPPFLPTTLALSLHQVRLFICLPSERVVGFTGSSLHWVPLSFLAGNVMLMRS